MRVIDYKLTYEEQETSVNISAADKIASIYTCIPAHIRKLDKLCEKYPDHYKLETQDQYSRTYLVPKKLIRFCSPAAKKILTEEQKEILRERMRRIHQK
jgi:hypothetical protein